MGASRSGKCVELHIELRSECLRRGERAFAGGRLQGAGDHGNATGSNGCGATLDSMGNPLCCWSILDVERRIELSSHGLNVFHEDADQAWMQLRPTHHVELLSEGAIDDRHRSEVEGHGCIPFRWNVETVAGLVGEGAAPSAEAEMRATAGGVKDA